MKRLRRLCFALALGLGLSLTTAGVSTAAPEVVAACPPEGTRFKTPTTGATVFLVGPSGFLYSIPSEAVYRKLWRTWDGIITIDRASCNKSSYALTNGRLRHWDGGGANVYIWDESWDDFGMTNRYRWIESWSIFTEKYHFDPEAIEEVKYGSDIYPILEPNWT
ncbi:hypothetical protein [Streptomyces sp. 4N124]|uniref:hypothetical protein n=1 Tax=Streptomyces sp. 4N124 TaxID=3457420 RepID=UPI003FD0BF48